MFGIASDHRTGNWWDIGNWSAPVQITRQDNTSPAPSNPWRNSPQDWPAFLTTASYWIWSESQVDYGKAGIVSFKCFITNANSFPIPIQMVIAADDEAQVYLDGDPWIFANSWQQTNTSEVAWIASGDHAVTIVASCGSYPATGANIYKNPAGMLCSILLLSQGDGGTPKAGWAPSTSANWTCAGYLSVLPGWTIGDILQQLYSEAQERGVTSFDQFTLGFDDLIDSYGNAWLKDGSQWLFDIFSSYSNIVDRLTDTACEVWFDKDLKLQAARQRGYDRARVTTIATYKDLLIDDGAAFLWDFQNATQGETLHSAYSPGVDTAVTVQLDEVSGGQGFCFDPIAKVFTGYKMQGVAGSELLAPAADKFGIAPKNLASSTQLLGFYNYDCVSPTNGNTSIPFTTGDNGFTLEMLHGGSYWFMNLQMYDADVATNFDNATAALSSSINIFMYYNDDNNKLFQDQLKILIQDNNTSAPFATFTNYLLFPRDNIEHIWTFQWVSQGRDSVLLIFRDGVECANISVPVTNINPGSVVFTIQQNTGTYNVKTNGRLGYVALYQSLLSEDQIASHASAMVTGGIARIIKPTVIFQKAKNIINTELTAEYSAKTAIVTRSRNSVAGVLAPQAAISEFGRIEGYNDSTSKTIADARRNSRQVISASLETQTSATLAFHPSYRPWRDFGVGDWVLAPDETGNLVRRRVMSIGLTVDAETGRSLYEVELDSVQNEESKRIAMWLKRTLPQGSLDGLLADQG